MSRGFSNWSPNYFRRSQNELEQLLGRAEAAQRLQGGGRVRGGWLAAGSSRDAGVSVFRDPELGGAPRCARDRDRLSDRAYDRLGLRIDAARLETNRRC